MKHPQTMGELPFRWRPFVVGSVMLFGLLEGTAISLAVATMLAVSFIEERGIVLEDYQLAALIAWIVLKYSAVSTAIYSAILSLVFVKWGWTRKLVYSMAFSLGLTIVTAEVSAWVITGEGTSNLGGGLAGMLICCFIGLFATWIFHRYLKIAERPS